MNEMRFQDQVVVITGAARGQGRSHALAFAREGTHLVICDTSRTYASVPYALGTQEELAQVAQEIEAMGRRVLAMDADVTDLHAMSHLVDTAHHQFGAIDIVVANAGLYSFGSTWELTEQQWDETLAVDLKGVWLTCKVILLANPRTYAIKAANFDVRVLARGSPCDHARNRTTLIAVAITKCWRCVFRIPQ